MNMFSVIFILLVRSVLCQQVSRECNIHVEFQCLNGQCIGKEKWCNSVQDCDDNSDENFCDGRVVCRSHHFTCQNGRCIPTNGKCDGYDDCRDGSDEDSIACGDVLVAVRAESDIYPDDYLQPELSIPSGRPAQVEYNKSIKQAVAAAAKYLISQRHSDYGWGTAVSTSRALVALAFAERVQEFDEHEKKLMMKNLNIQLSLELIPNYKGTSISHLALFINALYATCQNPRNFQGMDLVALLQSKTDVSMNSNFSLPIGLLTLCIAKENSVEYADQLRKMYITSSNTISLNALTMIAIACMRNGGYNFNSEVTSFLHKLKDYEDLESDVYTKALSIQASNAVGYATPSSQLLKYQQSNGSFGDLLATYYAIPALLNTSLVELKCENLEKYEGVTGRLFSKPGKESKKVTYSLWTAPDADSNSRSMVITYEGNKTLFDIMKIAASRDETYSFMFDDKNGKKVYSLAGIPNDVETGMKWNLYHANTDMVSRNSNTELIEIKKGVDNIYPAQQENNHYIFWLKRS